MEPTLERRPVEPADLQRLRFLQGASLSPDGETVVYCVSHIDPAKDVEFSTLWLLSLNSGVSRQLTSGLARDGSPQWSPDGRSIAFLSSRSGAPQIYCIPVDGGEAREITAMPQGVGAGPLWSPDGRSLAFTSGPECRRDPSKPYRVTRALFRADGAGLVDDVVQQVYLVSSEGGKPAQLTSESYQKSLLAWSPDGRELLFTASFFPDCVDSQQSLWSLDLAGHARPVVEGWAQIGAAAWTPDGRRIVFVGRPWGHADRVKRDLWVVSREGGVPECRTPSLDVGVGGWLQPDMPTLQALSPKILVSASGGAALAQVETHGMTHIYRVAVDGAESWSPVVTGERSCMLMGADGRHLVYGVSTMNNPTDLCAAAPDGSAERQLTDINAWWPAERRLPSVKHLQVPSADGVPVEGWLMIPAGLEAPYPTILYTHGGPRNSFGHVFSFDFQMLAGAGYAVLFVNYRGSSGYGDPFAAAINGNWGDLSYADSMAAVDHVIADGLADPDRLGCCGLSYGGYLSCWIVGHTDRFKAAVPENPVTNLASLYGVSDGGLLLAIEYMGGRPHERPEEYRRCSPITYAHRCTTPTLLIQGESDLRCPPEQSEQFYAALKANGCIVEMLRFPGHSHVGSVAGSPVVRRAQNEALLGWMNRYVLGRADGCPKQQESGSEGLPLSTTDRRHVAVKE